MIAIGRATKLSMGLMLGLFIVSAFGQTPPTATEAFNLRIKCKTMADEKAESLINTRPLTYADGASAGMSAVAVDALNRTNAENRELIQEYHSSKYDAKTNRCYIEIFQHKKIGKHKSIEVQVRQIYDGQTDELLATAGFENGTMSGVVFDPQHPPKNPPDKKSGWDEAHDYMNEMMLDNRR